MTQAVAILAGMFLPLAAAGDPAPGGAAGQYGRSVAACTALSDMDGQQCLAGLLEPIDGQLTRSYESALEAAAAQGRAAELREAQAKWQSFVDAQCGFERAQFRGGTGYWSAFYICHIRHAAARIDDLDRAIGQ